MDERQIEVKNQFLPPYDPEENIQLLNNIYHRFINEENENNRQYAIEKLQEYRYVPKSYCIPEGRYVRWINVQNARDMPLKHGGFVVSDNGYSVGVLLNGKVIKVSKKSVLLFVKITDSEKIFFSLHNINGV